MSYCVYRHSYIPSVLSMSLHINLCLLYVCLYHSKKENRFSIVQDIKLCTSFN